MCMNVWHPYSIMWTLNSKLITQSLIAYYDLADSESGKRSLKKEDALHACLFCPPLTFFPLDEPTYSR